MIDVKTIDAKTIDYNVELITETGQTYNLDGVRLSVDLEENENELAQRATVRLAQTQVGGAWLHAVAKINCLVRIYARWNGNRRLVFEGTLWDWDYTSDTQKELTITAYDPLIRLRQSRDFYYYQSGQTTRELVAAICNEWNIPVVYPWAHSITHGEKAFRGVKRVSDMLVGLLDEVTDKTGEKYVLRYADGQVHIMGYGTNETVYLLDRGATVSTSEALTVNNLVTRVKVYGRREDDDRRPLDSVAEGDTRFGVLQEVVLRDSNTTLGDAMAEAREIINRRGEPERTINWRGQDLPFLRKGDKVEVKAGSLIGFFYVESVAHNGETRLMELTLSREKTVPVAAAEESATFQVGDAVRLNGPVFRDSFGNGQGRTFVDRRDTVTILASLERAAPYHIGSVGWARPGDITRG